MVLLPKSKHGPSRSSSMKDRQRPFLTRVLSSCVPAVSVGYEYEACPDLILWEKRTAVLQGYEIDASKLGGWSLDKHHALNIQSGEWNHGSP